MCHGFRTPLVEDALQHGIQGEIQDHGPVAATIAVPTVRVHSRQRPVSAARHRTWLPSGHKVNDHTVTRLLD